MLYLPRKNSFKLAMLCLLLAAAGCTKVTPPPREEPLKIKVADIKRYDAFKERELRLRAASEQRAKQAEADVWQTLKDGFSLQIQSSPHADEYERWLAEHPRHVAKVSKRVKLALPYIVEEIQNRQLPMELALIPIIESGINTLATSPAGAAGIWQIMRSTGKWLGLQVTGSIDERRNIIESTRVSLDYLVYLTDYYNGNWALGITAYNAGNGNVNKALRKKNKSSRYEKPWELPLKKESKLYFSKIIGLRNYLLKTGHDYPALAPLPLDNFFTVSRTAPSRSFANIAKQYNSDIEVIRFLNADYLSQRTSKNRTTILIPKDIRSPVIANDYAIATIKPKLIKHKIERGESLGVIAKKYNTTVSKLKRLNNITSNLIRTGKILLIPVY